MQDPDVRRIGVARLRELLPRPQQVMRLPALRRRGAQALRAQPTGPVRGLRRDLQQAIVQRDRLLEALLSHQQAGQRAQGHGLIRNRAEDRAQVRLRLAGPAALHHQIRERQASVPGLLGQRAVDRRAQARLRIVVAAIVPGDAGVPQPRPEDHALQLPFPHVAPFRSQPARALQQIPRPLKILLARRLRRLLLQDEREAEPGVGVRRNRSEVRFRRGQVAALEGGESRLLRLCRAATGDQRPAVHRVRVVARQIEQPLCLAQVPAIQRGESIPDDGRIARALQVPGDLGVPGMRFEPLAKQGHVAIRRRQPEQRLPPARGGVLADGGIAREHGEHADALAARLVPVGEQLRQSEPVADLRRRAARQPPQPVARLLPSSRRAAHGLVVLEREIAGRPGRPEQLAILRRAFRGVAFMHLLARLREKGDEPRPQLDLPSQHRHVRMRGGHPLQPGEHLAGLLHASRPGIEPSHRRQRLGIVRRNLQHLLPGIVRLVRSGARLPVPGVADETAQQIVRRRRGGDRREDDDQRARPMHRVSQAGASEPSAPKR